MSQAAWPILNPAEAPSSSEVPVTIDRDGFTDLYRQNFPAVAGYLYRRTGNHAVAEDLAAETFLAAWKALPRYQPTQVPFRAWLLRIATNQANALARRERSRQRRLRFFKPITTSHPPRPDADPLIDALGRLTPDHQSVISLVHLEELTVQQAARVLDIPEGTVKSRLLRAREALKRELTRAGGTP